jgi:hypothetical protein
MYDPRFEKAVQRKMEELEFRPSESVWVTIEKTLPTERRRRGVPFFWRILIPAVVLTAIGGAYYFGEKAGRKAGAMVIRQKTAATAEQRGDATKAVAETGMPVGGKDAGTATKTVAETGMTAAGNDAGRAGKRTSAMHAAAKREMPAGNTMLETRASGNRGVAAGGATPERLQATFARAGGQATDPTGSDITAYLYRPGLQDQRVFHGVSSTSPGSGKKLINLNTLSQVRRPWAAGFVAGAGFDRLNRLDGEQAAGYASYTASLYGLPRATGKNYVSDVRPGSSFYAGIYLQKPVSDRWVFHTGLDLHYYSTSISIGQQVNVIASPSASLLNQTTLAAAPAPLVYMVGDEQTYINRYYFLELPVSVQYRVNRSKLLPLFVEAGGAVSRLMGSNAIFYNPLTGLYLKNENVLSKTQFNLSSALMLGLPIHGIRIQAGPEVQYGITPLVNTQGLGDQHFFYGGVRLVVLPGRR